MNEDNTVDEATKALEQPVDILLVDDDEQWARVTARLLETAEPAFDITVANSYTDGKRLFEKRDPECVLCDYQLGDDTGLTLLEDVRGVDANRPFLLITGRGDEVVASEAIGRGVSDYLPKDHDDEQATVLANRLRTIISSYRANQQLHRERSGKAAAVEVLTATANASDVLEEFCRLLIEEHGYAGAWIGTATASGPVVPRAAVGCDEYLTSVISEHNPESRSRDPAIAALRSGELVVTSATDSNPTENSSDYQRIAPSDYQRIGLEHGFNSGAGVPIRYDAVQFGVLGVYTPESNITSQDRSLLQEFAELIGYARQRDEWKQSLLSSRSVSIDVTITDEDVHLVQLARTTTAPVEITVLSVVERTDRQTLYLARVEGVSPDELESAVGSCDGLDLLEWTRESNTIRCDLLASPPTPEPSLTEVGVRYDSTSVSAEQITLSGRVPKPGSVPSIVDSLEETYDDVTVSIAWSRTESAPQSLGSAADVLETLTDRQQEVLRHAFYDGYFEIPRGSSATELSDRLDIARATFTQHLRAGQRKIFEQLL
ncbi:helix-turn-helix domain-containing protein [Natrarchaeobius sp. A-rgal3]|uniref:helix-turn-helix domain-containing protein n=1 Tax=Natrarchaeobius versutus TaxID=1679078 RepID=UPI00350FD08C